MTQSVKVGALACQMSSYLRTLSTRVISCVPAATPAPAKKGAVTVGDVAPGFDVVFEDSVLFPEGGGQPSDLGWINETNEVSKVRRTGDTCVVTVKNALEVGAEVTMTVDWNRRLDQMQHHTAQHVITAVVEKELGLPTESWAFSHPTCYIQVPTPPAATTAGDGDEGGTDERKATIKKAVGKKKPDEASTGSIDPKDLRKVDQLCNDLIFNQTKVTRHVFPSRNEVPESRSRGIPADVNGPIRLIEVDGVDTCTCCGTHVDNLSQLQLIKILHTEVKGDKTKIHFVVGQRALNYFSAMYDRERAFAKDLSSSVDQLVFNSERRGKELTEATRSNKKLFAEVATLVSPVVAEEAVSSSALVYTYLREDVDIDFLGTVATAIKEKEKEVAAAAADGAGVAKNYVLACGSLKGGPGEGALMMWGPTIGPLAQDTILPALEGKGGQTKTGFRAKCNLKGWKQLVKDLAVLKDLPLA